MKRIQSISAEGAVTALRLSTDRQVVISVHDRRRVRLWHVNDLSPLAEIGLDYDVFSCAVSLDHTLLAVTTYSLDVYLFELPSGALRAHQDDRHAYAVDFLGNSGRLAVTHPITLYRNDHEIRLYDLSLRHIESLLMPFAEVGFEMRCIPERNQFAINGIGVTIWDMDVLSVVRSINCDTLNAGWETTCFDILANGQIIAIGFAQSGGYRRPATAICTVDMSTGKLLHWVDREALFVQYPTSVSLSGDGKHLAATAWDTPIAAVWDIQTGVCIGQTELPGASGVAFIDNRRVLVGAGLPDPLTVWEI